MANSASIVVIGSINMDLVFRAPRRPGAGETILGSDLMTIPGGKGANQAVAVGRLGAVVHMVGRVGDDEMGQRLLNGLRLHNVNTDQVTVTEGVASGCAMILVTPEGENSIVVAPGANARLVPADIDRAGDLIASASIVLMQLEIPLPTVRHALRLCRRAGVAVILDPAPAPRELPRELYRVDYLTPNQSEARILLGLEDESGSQSRRQVEPKQIAGELLARGARNVVLKMGSRGAMTISHEGRIERVRALKAEVVDTTAAGDAFTAALAVGLSEGMPLEDAARLAAAAGALCCESFGAQPALPSRPAVEKRLRRG